MFNLETTLNQPCTKWHMYVVGPSKITEKLTRTDKPIENRAEPTLFGSVLYTYFSFTRFSSGQNTLIRAEIDKPNRTDLIQFGFGFDSFYSVHVLPLFGFRVGSSPLLNPSMWRVRWAMSHPQSIIILHMYHAIKSNMIKCIQYWFLAHLKNC